MIDDFDAWYAELRPRMLAALAAWSGDAAVADEALDEAFLRAFERWNRVRSSPSPAGWVWRTATNLVRRHHRRRALEWRSARRGERPSEGVIDRHEDVDLSAALLTLTDRQRTVIALHHLADLPYAEIADVLGVTVGTVSATLHQARAHLAEALEPTRTDQTPLGGPAASTGPAASSGPTTATTPPQRPASGTTIDGATP